MDWALFVLVIMFSGMLWAEIDLEMTRRRQR
jgi:hypothetical protein